MKGTIRQRRQGRFLVFFLAKVFRRRFDFGSRHPCSIQRRIGNESHFVCLVGFKGSIENKLEMKLARKKEIVSFRSLN